MVVKVTAEFNLDGFEHQLKSAREAYCALTKRSVTDVAASVGISTAHLYNVEKGGSVSIVVLTKLCKLIGLELPEMKVEGDRHE